MAAAAPTVEDMFQQLLNSQRTMDTNARFDELLKRVVDIEVAQSLAVYPTSAPEDHLKSSNIQHQVFFTNQQ